MDGKLMAGETPKTRSYAQPVKTRSETIKRDQDAALGIDRHSFFLGPMDQGFMGRSPLEGRFIVRPSNDAEVTPIANPAAVRAYTRNAPYMEEFMSDPQTMMYEIMRLRESVAEKPGDPVDEYRLRVLTQALGDVFGMQPGSVRAQAPMAPSDIDAGYVTTPQSPPTMPRRGR
jgi:hypothetical protein